MIGSNDLIYRMSCKDMLRLYALLVIFYAVSATKMVGYIGPACAVVVGGTNFQNSDMVLGRFTIYARFLHPTFESGRGPRFLQIPGMMHALGYGIKLKI